MLIQLVLPLFEGDAAAALAILDSDAPVVYLFQEVAGTQLIFNAQHSGSEGHDGDGRICLTPCIFQDVEFGNTKWVLPVEVEYVVEDFRIPVKEELVTLDNVVIAQIQLLAVVGVCGQSADSGLGISGS